MLVYTRCGIERERERERRGGWRGAWEDRGGYQEVLFFIFIFFSFNFIFYTYIYHFFPLCGVEGERTRSRRLLTIILCFLQSCNYCKKLMLSALFWSRRLFTYACATRILAAAIVYSRAATISFNASGGARQFESGVWLSEYSMHNSW